MELELLGWKSKGLRSLDLDLEFSKGDGLYKITLLQMPNGSGKTTTLNCLRAALTGEAESWTPEIVRQFAPRDSTSRGLFELKLRTGKTRLTFGMNFDFEAGNVQYYTTLNQGREQKYGPPAELKRFLNSHFVSLLVFDGELPQALLDPTQVRASEAIDAFFQLYLLEDLSKRIEEIWERRIQGVGVTEQRGLSRRRNRAKELKEQISNILSIKKKAQEELSDIEKVIPSLAQKINHNMSLTEEQRQKLEELKGCTEIAEEQARDKLKQVMQFIRAPYRANPLFMDALVTLKDRLDILKLPESSSRQFFEELAKEQSCVCGRKLEETHRQTIRSCAANYLGSETQSTLNRMKSEIEEYARLEINTPLNQELEFLKTLVHERDSLRTQKKRLEQEIIEKSGDEALESLQRELEQKETRANDLRELLEQISSDLEPSDITDITKIVSLPYLRKELKRAEELLSQATGTNILRQNKTQLVDILNESLQLSREILIDKIRIEMNSSINNLLEGHRISVARIDRSLSLEHQEGASMGQTLAVGYAFLATLFGRAVHKFPFVVDAPVVALDSKVRAEVGKIIPNVCNQFIGFTLDNERMGFVDSLERVKPGDIQYITAFRDSAANGYLTNNLPPTGVQRIDKTIIVHGREFFHDATFVSNEEQ